MRKPLGLFRRRPSKVEAELAETKDRLLGMERAYADARERSQMFTGIETSLRVVVFPHEYSLGQLGDARSDLRTRLIQLGVEA
jgi:hypothetical protein